MWEWIIFNWNKLAAKTPWKIWKLKYILFTFTFVKPLANVDFLYIECFCSSVFKDLLTQAQKEIICRESFTIESCEVH